MKRHWKAIVLSLSAVTGLALGFAFAWVFCGPFSLESATAKVKEEAVLLNGHDPNRMLVEASLFCFAPPVEEPGHCEALSVFSLKASRPQCIVALL